MLIFTSQNITDTIRHCNVKYTATAKLWNYIEAVFFVIIL